MRTHGLTQRLRRLMHARSAPLARGITLGVSALVLTALVVLALDVRGLADTVDTRTRERETGDIRHGLFVLAEATVAEHLVFAGSPEAAAWLRNGFDAVARGGRFWANVILDPAEHAYVVDATGRTILAESVAPDRRDEERLRDLRTIAPVITLLRDRRQAAMAENAARPIFPGTYAHDIADVAGQPSLVSAIAIAPAHGAHDETSPVLVHVTPIDQRVIGQLTSIARLPGLALARSDQRDPATASMALTASDGRPVAHLAWTTARPGWTVLGALLPMVGLSALVVLIQGLATAGALSRSAATLAASEAEALRQSRSDAATGLANRRWFEACFAERCRDLADRTFGLVLIDLDYFKAINDTRGHAAGDAVISAVADRLKALPWPGAFVAARLGGDEFAVLTPALPDRDTLHDLCAALLASLMSPVQVEGTSLPVSASVGAAFWPFDGRDLSALMKSADTALYDAKRAGRGCFRIHDEAGSLAAALRLAVAEPLAPVAGHARSA